MCVIDPIIKLRVIDPKLNKLYHYSIGYATNLPLG